MKSIGIQFGSYPNTNTYLLWYPRQDEDGPEGVFHLCGTTSCKVVSEDPIKAAEEFLTRGNERAVIEADGTISYVQRWTEEPDFTPEMEPGGLRSSHLGYGLKIFANGEGNFAVCVSKGSRAGHAAYFTYVYEYKHTIWCAGDSAHAAWQKGRAHVDEFLGREERVLLHTNQYEIVVIDGDDVLFIRTKSHSEKRIKTGSLADLVTHSGLRPTDWRHESALMENEEVYNTFLGLLQAEVTR